MKPKIIKEEEEETDEERTGNIEFPKRTDHILRCFENRDNFKEKSTLRNIIRNQTEFKSKVSTWDMDSLCRDLIDRKGEPEKINTECKIIFGILGIEGDMKMEKIIIEHLINIFAIYKNGRERKGKYKRIKRSEKFTRIVNFTQKGKSLRNTRK
jgi:hypothetical protein